MATIVVDSDRGGVAVFDNESVHDDLARRYAGTPVGVAPRGGQH